MEIILIESATKLHHVEDPSTCYEKAWKSNENSDLILEMSLKIKKQWKTVPLVPVCLQVT